MTPDTQNAAVSRAKKSGAFQRRSFEVTGRFQPASTII